MLQRLHCLFLFLFLSFIFQPAFSHQEHTHNMRIGEINFPTSGNKQAQVFFEHGVMWLHSFEYQKARTDFQKAKAMDPKFVMAYWGEAMTYNHPLWMEQDCDAAMRALTNLATTSIEREHKAKTKRERGFIKAINLLYGSGDKKSRDIAYMTTMRELYQQYPNDDEIASFYALALLGATEGERNFQTYMQAAGIIEEIYTRNQKHPGVMHYVIHSYDDPIHAPLGLRAARLYAKIAPDSPHALHMPSHIFLALGLWDDVIASNKAAWEIGKKQNLSGEAKNFTVDDLHALEWLSYGYLQQQKYQDAYQLTKTMQSIAENSQSPMSKWYYALMRAAYITESQNWQADLKPLDMNHIELSARASNLYASALIALNKQPGKPDIQQAKIILNELLEIIPQKVSPEDTYKDYFTSISPTGVIAAKITALELQAQIKLFEGKKAAAISLLKQATQLETKTSFGYGPPLPVKPSFELAAEFLLENKQYKAAYQQYMIALKRTPNRLKTTQGLQQTTMKLKKLCLCTPKGIQPYFNKLLKPEQHL